MGWFAGGPAKRAMLLHTKVPGTIYCRPEEQVQREDGFTELNLLPNYARCAGCVWLLKIARVGLFRVQDLIFKSLITGGVFLHSPPKGG